MEAENKCNICDRSFEKASALAKHHSAKYAHNGLKRDKTTNKIYFSCDICGKEFDNQRAFHQHRMYTQCANVTVADATQEEDFSMDFIPSKLSHEKVRVIELSTSITLDYLQETIRHTFQRLREEMIPLYTSSNLGHADAYNRARQTIDPFETELISILMNKTTRITDELKRDMESSRNI